MFASCHLKLRDTETYDVWHGLRILDHRMPPHESPEPPKRGPNGLYRTQSSLICEAVEIHLITVPRSMNRVMPDIGINDNTSSITKRNPDLQCSVYYV